MCGGCEWNGHSCSGRCFNESGYIQGVCSYRDNEICSCCGNDIIENNEECDGGNDCDFLCFVNNTRTIKSTVGGVVSSSSHLINSIMLIFFIIIIN